MPLPASGTISISQVSTELTRASTAATSLGETAVRDLAGVASGAISMSNLHGKAAATFSYAQGAQLYNQENWPGSASIILTCSISATWNYTKIIHTTGFPTPPGESGSATGTSIEFYLDGTQAQGGDVVWEVSGTAGGVTRSCTVELYIPGNGVEN